MTKKSSLTYSSHTLVGPNKFLDSLLTFFYLQPKTTRPLVLGLFLLLYTSGYII